MYVGFVLDFSCLYRLHGVLPMPLQSDVCSVEVHNLLSFFQRSYTACSAVCALRCTRLLQVLIVPPTCGNCVQKSVLDVPDGRVGEGSEMRRMKDLSGRSMGRRKPPAPMTRALPCPIASPVLSVHSFSRQNCAIGTHCLGSSFPSL